MRTELADCLAVEDIVVGQRHRTDLGDIDALASSIRNRGLIHPVVVTPDYRLVAGERRLAAMKLLGMRTIPVTIIRTLADATDLLLAERDENTCRKDFIGSELAALGKRLEELERPKAAQRQGCRTDLGRTSGSTDPEVASNKSTNEFVGKALGVSGSTYKRAKALVAATNDDNPMVAEVARNQLAKVDAGQTGYQSAIDAVKKARAAANSGDNPAQDAQQEVAAPPKKRLTKHDSTEMLANINGMLNGVVESISFMDASDIDAEASRPVIENIRRSINKVRNLLKEIKNG